MLCSEQPVHLTGSQNYIHILSCLGVIHHRKRTFLLLGHTGHQRYAEDSGRIHIQKRSVIALRHRPKHLLGRLGCGQLANHIGVLGFQEADPAGTAGGKHREGFLIPVLQLLQKLTALFHNRKVRAEICIKNIGKTNPPKSRHQASGCGKFPAQAKLLAPGRPHCGRHLHHCDLIRICQSFQHLIHVISLPESSHRTMGDTLAAESAVCLFYLPVEGDIHRRTGACSRHVPDM